MWTILLFVITAVGAAEIRELSLENSVFLMDEQEICVPQNYKILRARIGFGQIYSSMNTHLARVRKTMGQYGSKNEPSQLRNARECSDTAKDSSGTCPLTSVIEIRGSQAKDRFRVINAQRSIEAKLNSFMASWNEFPRQFSSPVADLSIETISTYNVWPSTAFDSRSANLQTTYPEFPNVHFLNVDSTVIEHLNFLAGMNLTEDNRMISLPPVDEKESFEDIMILLAEQLEVAESQIGTMLAMTYSRTEKGYFPEVLFPFDQWLPTLYPASDEVKVEDLRLLRQLLSQHPLTVIKREPTCDPHRRPNAVVTECIVDFLTTLPDIKTLRRVQVQHFEPYSFPTNPNKPNAEWKKVVIPANPTVYKEGNTFVTLDKDVQCFPRAQFEQCQLCTTSTPFTPLREACLKTITAGAVRSPPCQLESTIEQPTARQVLTPSVDLKEAEPTKTLVLTNKDRSDLQESCANTTKIFELPYAAVVRLAKSCSFALVSSSGLTNSLNQAGIQVINKVTREIPKVIVDKLHSSTFDDVKEHFHEHGYIYIIVSAGIITFLLTCWFCACIYVCTKRPRTPRNHPQSPPVRPVLPSNEFSPVTPLLPITYNLGSPVV